MLQSSIAPRRADFNAAQCGSAMSGSGRRFLTRPTQRTLFDQQHGDETCGEKRRASCEQPTEQE